MYNPVPGVLPNVPASKGYTGGFGVGTFCQYHIIFAYLFQSCKVVVFVRLIKVSR